MYQAGPWDYPRRVVFKIEKPYGQLMHMYTFIVTNMDMEPYQIIQFYCGRSRMENFIKEGKSGFDFAAVSSHSKVVNANRMRLHMLAYNLFNWFRRLVLPANMRKQQVDTIRYHTYQYRQQHQQQPYSLFLSRNQLLYYWQVLLQVNHFLQEL